MNIKVERLRALLIGNEYYRFSIGDTYDLCFNGFKLSANAIEVDRGGELLKELQGFGLFTPNFPDPIDFGISLAFCANRSQKLIEVEVYDDCSILLRFENESSFKLLTNAKIVDWQWALMENENDPHCGFLVAAFDSSAIEIGKE